MIHFKDIIASHGGEPASFFSFDDENDKFRLLPYATLTASRNSSELSSLVGVYEWQNVPLIVLVDGDLLGDDPASLTTLRRIIAMRGDAQYIAVSRFGRLTVHQVGLDNKRAKSFVVHEPSNNSDLMVIPWLVNKRPGLPTRQRWIGDVILKLLSETLVGLSKIEIDDGDAISLVGRALFTRFLADRRLLLGPYKAMTSSQIAALFNSHDSVVGISNWLDATFNGDFLPLPEARIRALPKEAFQLVGNILHGAVSGQLPIQWAEDWANLDFAHIPVGVLSQAYERYLGQHQGKRQRKEGSFYTPRHIAELMIHASFAALARDNKSVEAKILDPAVGAGVFLIAAFRRLVEERWRQDKERPNTSVLREILYGQIRGFDINRSALRFAALGLYLMSIELDPDPEPDPIEKLRFDHNLLGRVLFELGDEADSNNLGSLGGDVAPEHDGQYDLVIGNPPWSSATSLDAWSSVINRVSQIARERTGDESIDAPLPNEVLDLPFVWRAMQWAKTDGQIAFALHARLLFQRGEGMDKAFAALCQSFNITGIINGSEVRQSKVWPNIDAPFCLLFARNCLPPPNATFRFVSPHLEGPLNQTGGWRIDAANAEIVSTTEIRNRPELLKTLYRGTRLDEEILSRVASKGFATFGEYWRDLPGHGGTARQPQCAGMGYKRLFLTSRPNPLEDDQPGYSAERMYDLPALEQGDFRGVQLDPSSFRKFRELRLARLDQRRDLSLYNGPMLLVRKSPPAGEPRIRGAVSLSSLAFNESYYGYTAHKQENASALVQYLCLIIGSKFALWHCLMTSGEFGFERDVIEKYVIQEVPLPPFDELSPAQCHEASALFTDLANGDTDELWERTDKFVAGLFGLTADDVQTISDTLTYALPFAKNKDVAQAPTEAPLRLAYAQRLAFELKPWGERYDRPMSVWPIEMPALSPWHFVCIGQKTDLALKKLKGDWAAAIALSDKLASTEIIIADSEADCLIVGRLNQARYWSVSQARLVARRIIWEHVDFLSGKPAG